MKKIKEIVAILLAILISLVAFLGVFQKENGVWKNLIPDYKFGMDVKGARELRYTIDSTEEEKYVYVDENGNIMGEVWKDGSAITAEDENTTEEEAEEQTESEEEISYAKETRTIKVTSDESLTKENFEQAKKIIQKRLKKQDVGDYNIRLDDVTGKLVVETTNDNENVELVEDLIGQVGKFEIIDYQNGLKLMDNSDIKKVSVVTSNTDGYNTYLQIEFNKVGAQKLKDISNKYVEIVEDDAEEHVDEEGEEHSHEDEETTKKYISVVLDGSKMMTTYFGEEMSNGILQINVGQSRTDYNEFLEDYESAQVIADVLNSGVLPITYELETDNFVKSEIDTQIVVIGVLCAIILATIILTIKFKLNGLLASILSVGYIALLSLACRYTNVIFTLNSLLVSFIVIAMNYAFVKIFLMNLKEKSASQAYNESMKKFYLTIIPVIVVAVVFTLSAYTSISSIGMILFWGIILNALYNFIFTRTVFVNKNK